MLRTEKGITLVALIITIIILVILAAVSITAVTRLGLIDYATEGAKKYQNAANDENVAMDSYESTLSSIVSTLSATPTEAPTAPAGS